tara:strand:- start:978 stop:1286 length:309 start_codon:yes stop_codon:yes gene_type:complete
MKKVFVYRMNAGMCGTDEAFTIVDEKPLTPDVESEYAADHGESYGVEQNEEGFYDESEPECWLEATVTTLAELDEVSGYLLYGSMQFEDLVKSLEAEGMVFQ